MAYVAKTFSLFCLSVSRCSGVVVFFLSLFVRKKFNANKMFTNKNVLEFCAHVQQCFQLGLLRAMFFFLLIFEIEIAVEVFIDWQIVEQLKSPIDYRNKSTTNAQSM